MQIMLILFYYYMCFVFDSYYFTSVDINAASSAEANIFTQTC
ncbi:MAG: hypothetical protein BWY04_00880 [candidate division CPR1 bacterium ADurb.Bin160]|uniref:Uncharacterized protein n=1 Tax=candidate division CPR1 bacterium ADurb.Bin160 TaxID=1852826 RepID=A0A1V5ZMX7_9BACT|nr:MAG: hypothetical protein BWY04_00880 [candidate division CPR1 bacterium ADurb.Bin160]